MIGVKVKKDLSEKVRVIKTEETNDIVIAFRISRNYYFIRKKISFEVI